MLAEIFSYISSYIFMSLLIHSIRWFSISLRANFNIILGSSSISISSLLVIKSYKFNFRINPFFNHIYNVIIIFNCHHLPSGFIFLHYLVFMLKFNELTSNLLEHQYTCRSLFFGLRYLNESFDDFIALSSCTH